MSADDEQAGAIGELILDQVKQQGCGCVRVSDGQIFIFTRDMLEMLLAKAIENVGDELVLVHVKRGPEA